MTEVAVVADVPAAAAELFIESVGGAVAARSRAAVALTGGSTAPPLYARLRPTRLPWEKAEIFFTDERAVPPEHELSNYRLAEEGLAEAALAPQARSKSPGPASTAHCSSGKP